MEDLLSLNTISQKDEKLHTPGLADTAILGYCLLWVMSTEISVDSRSVDSEIDYRPSIGRYFDDAPRLTIGHMSVIYRSTVGGISVNCRWYIGQLSFEYQSCVNLSGESNGFFLSKDIINYCYHAMGQHVAVRGAITL